MALAVTGSMTGSVICCMPKTAAWSCRSLCPRRWTISSADGSALAARSFLHDVAAGRFRVEGLTADEHGAVARLDEQYADLDLGLADLSVVILAHRFRTRRLLTFDERDFRSITPLAGGSFTLLPRDKTGS
jgi:hypothetical protein